MNLWFFRFYIISFNPLLYFAWFLVLHLFAHIMGFVTPNLQARLAALVSRTVWSLFLVCFT